MKRKVAVDEVLPVDPEENSQYSRFDQLNAVWWRQVEILVTENSGALLSQVQVVGRGLEVPWFNQRLSIEPDSRSISFVNGDKLQPTYQDGLVLLNLLNYLSRKHSLPKPLGLINENHLVGGTTFFRGPHLMASVRLAKRFAKNGAGFIAAGQRWGGKPVDFGEFALTFTIFPGLDWVVALWEEDDEFPARAQYLFDRNLGQFFQLDVIWALGNVVAAKLLTFSTI